MALLLTACNPSLGKDYDIPDLADATDLSTPDLASADLLAADLTMQSVGDLAVKTEPGQCYTNAHCGAGRTCNKELPGGLCDGCMNFGANCKSGFDDECIGGMCARGCTGDGDCLPGWSCASFMGSMYCRLKSCTLSSECGPHLECRTSGIGMVCQRFLCPASTCPTGTACMNGVCVEGYLSF